MDFSKFEEAIKTEQSKFNEIKDIKDAAKYDSICSNLNKTLADISLVAGFIPVESKKGLISILRSLRDFAMELVGYKKSFGEEKHEPVVEEVVPEQPVEPVQEDPLEIAVDEGLGDQSPSESQSMNLNNAKTLTLTNPNVPSNINPFGQQNAA